MSRENPSSDKNKKVGTETLFTIYPLSKELEQYKELARELKKIKTSLLDKDSKENNFKNWGIVANFARNLKRKYKDINSYWTYNMLIGSSTDDDKIPTKFDFPGEDSIEKFLRSQNP